MGHVVFLFSFSARCHSRAFGKLPFFSFLFSFSSCYSRTEQKCTTRSELLTMLSSVWLFGKRPHEAASMETARTKKNSASLAALYYSLSHHISTGSQITEEGTQNNTLFFSPVPQGSETVKKKEVRKQTSRTRLCCVCFLCSGCLFLPSLWSDVPEQGGSRRGHGARQKEKEKKLKDKTTEKRKQHKEKRSS